MEGGEENARSEAKVQEDGGGGHDKAVVGAPSASWAPDQRTVLVFLGPPGAGNVPSWV